MSTNSPPTINDCAQNCIANKLGDESIKAGNITTDIVDQWITAIESSYSSASGTFFTGYSTYGSEMGWLGFKVNGYCTVLAFRHNGRVYEGYRAKNGTWTFYKLPFGY